MFFRLLVSFLIALIPFKSNAESLVEDSEFFLKNKAEIKYNNTSNQKSREVYLKGFRIDDLQLSKLSKDKNLFDKVENEINIKRLKDSAISVFGLPTGVLLLYLSSLSRSQENMPINGVNLNYNPAYSTASFLLGIGGTIIFLYSIVNTFNLINEISGMGFAKILTDKEADEIIQNYNNQLKNKILNQDKKINIFNNNYLFNSNNNIMIFSIGKTF